MRCIFKRKFVVYILNTLCASSLAKIFETRKDRIKYIRRWELARALTKRGKKWHQLNAHSRPAKDIRLIRASGKARELLLLQKNK